MDWVSHWPLSEGGELRDELLAAYGSTERGYHDLRHLAEVLIRVGELSDHVAFDLEPVQLAAWFHDGVYDGRPGAEDRSAVWAEMALPTLGVRPDIVAEVGRLVRLTTDHRPDGDDANGAALSDADLAILASSRERYAEYTADVRREYAHVPDAAFRQGRAAILGELLAKPTLFHTAYAIAMWEDSARANVENELATLG